MDVLQFSKKELQERIDLCQKKMKQENMVGMLVSSDQNVTYYANFRTPCRWNTFTRPTFLFIPQVGKPILYAQIMFANVAKEYAHCCTVKSFDSLLGPTTDELINIFSELNMTKGNLGFELGQEQRIGFQVDTFLKLQKELTEANFVDASSIIWSQRLIKSEAEITCIRRACQATSYAFDRLYENIKAGMTERDITIMAQKFMLDGGAERPGFHIITSGPGGYDRICDSGRNRKLEEGDFLWLDMGAVYNGYWADFCRSGVVGKISKERSHTQNLIHEVTMEASELLKPGINIRDVAQACLDGMAKRGVEIKFDCGRLGHGIGLNSTELPSVTLQDDLVLEEGMVIALEPGLATDHGLYDIEEIFVVRKNGGECLSDSNRELNIIPL